MGKCISNYRKLKIITRLKEISEKEHNQDFMLIKFLELYTPIISNNIIEVTVSMLPKEIDY